MPREYEEDQPQQENQQWIVVIKNKNKHKGAVKNKTIHNRGSQNIFSPQLQEEISEKFLHSQAFRINEKLVEQAIQKIFQMSNTNTNRGFHLECLGLGNFLTNKKSYIQLLFFENILLKLSKRTEQENTSIQQTTSEHKQSLQAQINQPYISTSVYDPAFTKQQIAYIKQKGHNLQEKFELKQTKINILFMPHCERNLYEFVYEQYQKVIAKQRTPLIVIGNSILDYIQRCELIRESVPKIFRTTKVKQQKLVDYQNALNDTYILL